MNNWILAQIINVGKQALEHPLISSVGAFGLMFFEYGFGAVKAVLVAFLLYLVLIALDWLTGTSAAKRDGIDTSAYGIEGIKRTVFLICLPVIARLLDVIMHTEVIVTGIVIAVLSRSIARSVIANTKRAGWDKWLPSWAIEWVSAELEHKDTRAKQRLEEITMKGSERNDV
ncbi:phage holin family protein [Lysinibacillus fusiformis]|uniref:phage holin family protein n=1 Tax=Lysinibacillus fusiformis TaxID=28031 RepID=UPI00263B33CF|nr:phage holin family protein [Lysinibacillus fusiformis]MDC6267707.1 phage holin family protein [Lysinibacillus sphaericus]MDN4967803.1 phage holin family protein [Lysinibacillus fusiformis]MDN4967859.1 phage holin family protein [Lysinibacillus fusiformis]